ncbi:1-phosphofructokinase [Thermophilibacter mediterraneus]|uniref:1-phosphofructokinase n=1 Tax=Thermophilibacter mediterraneus TaxID=1871031 RepID=UPI0009312CA8|nr:1-phosphofructokinase [Thermophilibacter mediterraneus]
MIYTVTLNPALDKTATVDGFVVDEVNRIGELREDPGGKGINVTKVIAKLGGTSRAVALLGGSVGGRIERMLAAEGIDVWAFEAHGETRTNLKVVDPRLDTHTDINEPGPVASVAQLDDMRSALVAELSPGDIVVLSGSLPKGAPVATYAAWARACSDAGAKVFLDADGDALVRGLDAHPYLVKPNDAELSRLCGERLGDTADVARRARELVEGGVRRVVVSMGGAGAVVVDGERALLARSPRVPVGSTVGAGDSVVAALAYAEERGMSLEQTMRLAMATGAANVMQSGTQAAERSQVDALVDRVVIEEL